MIVMKFGGTSVEDAAAIDRSCSIVESRIGQIPLVVVSALAGATNGLLEAGRLASSRRLAEALPVIDRLEARHVELLPSLAPHFAELRSLLAAISAIGEFSPRTQDLIASFGEVMSAQIFTHRLKQRGHNAECVDSRKFMVTDDRFTQAVPQMPEIVERATAQVAPLLTAGRIVVMGGYIGATRDGTTTTLGRGGSDYSAALAGAALNASEIQIWTDVDGMMTTDPRIVPHAWKVREISFEEASELAYFGAKVLHPLTVLPAVERGIPVLILNSRKPSGTGTRISRDPIPCNNLIKSIAFKRGITIVTVTSSRMLMAHGFLKALFEIFDRHQTSVDMVATSEVSVSLTLDNTRSLTAIRAELETLGDVRIDDAMALICLVGHDLKHRRGVATTAFQAIPDINVWMVSHGASNINFSFLIKEQDAVQAVRQLHDAFFADFDPSVFER